MSSLPIVDVAGKKVGSRDLPADIFEAKVSVPLMHQVVVAAGASLRAGTHATKTRGDVSAASLASYRRRLEESFVLKDLRKYQHLPEFLDGHGFQGLHHASS